MDLEFIKDISSFPALKSHYSRAQKSGRYLSANFNIAKMFDLYKAKSEEESRKSLQKKEKEKALKSGRLWNSGHLTYLLTPDPDVEAKLVFYKRQL